MNHFVAPLRWALLSICLLATVPLVRAQAPAAPAPAAAKQRFDVFEYQVEGNTVLPAERIERTVYPFMGEGRTIDDVEAARAALEAAYRDAGYPTVLVDVPEQKVVSGLVVLNVVEGRVARLRVLGSRYFSQDRIIATVPALAEGAVPYLPDAQKQLAEVNTSADKRVTPMLRPGKLPGTTEVDLQVEDQLPLHGSIEINNHNAPQTTATRLLAGLRYSNLFQRDHTIGLQVQTSPQKTAEVKVVAGSYSLPAQGGTLVFSALRSDSSSFVGNGIGVFGKGTVVGARYLLPLMGDKPSTDLFQSLSLGIDYKDSDQALQLDDGTGFTTPIRYVPFSLAYSGSSTDAAGATDFNLGLVFAVRGLGSHEQQFADKRFQARSNFAILKFGLSRTQKLPLDFSLYGRAEGQISDQPLISNEQFVAGGQDSVRGYLESTQTGDSALRTTLELRSPSLAPKDSRIELLQLRTFADAAYLRLRAPLPGTHERYGLASIGVGLSLKAREGLSLRADLAWPLRDSGTQEAHKARLQASAQYEF